MRWPRIEPLNLVDSSLLVNWQSTSFCVFFLDSSSFKVFPRTTTNQRALFNLPSLRNPRNRKNPNAAVSSLA
jgi:hypothetical protein